MPSEQDVEYLKAKVGYALEFLLQAADERVSWNQSEDPTTSERSAYTFLPGIYLSRSSQYLQHEENDVISPASSSISPSVGNQGGDSTTQIILHGDNKFEYLRTIKRSGARAMELTVEMEGDWSKPVLNRTRRGQNDQRVTLQAQRIRFQWLPNYERQTSLEPLARHDTDWENVGSSEQGFSSIVMVFQCLSGCLENIGAVMPLQILPNSPACRILAGFSKEIADELGTPVDVMTEQWLPSSGLRLFLARNAKEVKVKKFNPFFCLTVALRTGHHSSAKN